MRKDSVTTRIAEELDETRRRLRAMGLAHDLTEIDRIIAQEVDKIFFKEKKKDKDMFDKIFG